MSDEGGDIPEDFEGEDEEGLGSNLTFVAEGPEPPVYVFEGVTRTLCLANPSKDIHPFSWIKGCIGFDQYHKPGSQQPDDFRFIVQVGDGFEYRELTECYNAGSEKEYTPKVNNFKVVN